MKNILKWPNINDPYKVDNNTYGLILMIVFYFKEKYFGIDISLEK